MSGTDWLTRTEAADWLRVHPDTVTNIVNEMEAEGLPGIWREGRGFLRVNKQDMSDYLRTRRRRK